MRAKWLRFERFIDTYFTALMVAASGLVVGVCLVVLAIQGGTTT